MPDTDVLLGRFPKAAFSHLPTPLAAMSNLGRELGYSNLFVKRDDLTGLGMGGNKARQLEYYFGAALAEDADTVLITGAVQSNFVRQCAAAARKLGLDCEIQLENRVGGMPEGQEKVGNYLLDRLLGVKVHHFPIGEDEAAADANLEAIAAGIRARGGRPYVIHLGAEHAPLGALGYVDCAREIIADVDRLGLALGAIVTASGSAITHTGLLTGLRLFGNEAPVFGVCVRRKSDIQSPRVLKRCRDLEAMLGAGAVVADSDVWTSDAYLAGGYGKAGTETLAAIETGARLETLILDPVYTAKAFAGLIGMARQGALPKNGAVVFVHTGGGPGLFAYAHLWAPAA
ncbi:MAG: D-cysteine desulfhydrase family protein [Proteobacteria bacterium]|nr:D-cysteine desulfhydrase family protein [Pseudomonadota bacterium]